ncbi:hypothetical protein [Nocardia australiensis]|uniref:hypothetical protein n=1 Tax=Nocardia australiensis TaxID=2887191 RepID=UPI001D157F66|nr:hypothetical protein [Nocardia australiensis]
MQRTSAAIAASATLFTLLLAGCNDDAASSAAGSTSASAATSSAAIPGLDDIKTGTFVVSFRSAFPKLADGKDDTKIRDILVDTCKDIKGGKSEDDVVQNIIKRTQSGSVEASKEEAQAIYQMTKLLC